MSKKKDEIREIRVQYKNGREFFLHDYNIRDIEEAVRILETLETVKRAFELLREIFK